MSSILNLIPVASPALPYGTEVAVLGVGGPSVVGKFLKEDGSVYTQASNANLFNATGHIPKLQTRTSVHSLPASCVIAGAVSGRNNPISTFQDLKNCWLDTDGICVPYMKTTDGTVGVARSTDNASWSDGTPCAFGPGSFASVDQTNSQSRFSAYLKGIICQRANDGVAKDVIYYVNGGDPVYSTKIFAIGTEKVVDVACDATTMFVLTNTVAGATNTLYKAAFAAPTTWSTLAFPTSPAWSSNSTNVAIWYFDGAIWITNSSKVWRSTDHGANWTDKTVTGAYLNVNLCDGVFVLTNNGSATQDFCVTGQTALTAVTGFTPTGGASATLITSGKSGNFFQLSGTFSGQAGIYWIDATVGTCALAQLLSGRDNSAAPALQSQTVIDDGSFVIGEAASTGAPPFALTAALKGGEGNKTSHGSLDLKTGQAAAFSFLQVGKVGAGAARAGVDTSGTAYSIARPYDPATQFQVPLQLAYVVAMNGANIGRVTRPGMTEYILGG